MEEQNKIQHSKNNLMSSFSKAHQFMDSKQKYNENLAIEDFLLQQNDKQNLANLEFSEFCNLFNDQMIKCNDLNDFNHQALNHKSSEIIKFNVHSQQVLGSNLSPNDSNLSQTTSHEQMKSNQFSFLINGHNAQLPLGSQDPYYLGSLQQGIIRSDNCNNILQKQNKQPTSNNYDKENNINSMEDLQVNQHTEVRPEKFKEQSFTTTLNDISHDRTNFQQQFQAFKSALSSNYFQNQDQHQSQLKPYNSNEKLKSQTIQQVQDIVPEIKDFQLPEIFGVSNKQILNEDINNNQIDLGYSQQINNNSSEGFSQQVTPQNKYNQHHDHLSQVSSKKRVKIDAIWKPILRKFRQYYQNKLKKSPLGVGYNYWREDRLIMKIQEFMININLPLTYSSNNRCIAAMIQIIFSAKGSKEISQEKLSLKLGHDMKQIKNRYIEVFTSNNRPLISMFFSDKFVITLWNIYLTNSETHQSHMNHLKTKEPQAYQAFCQEIDYLMTEYDTVENLLFLK